MRYSTVARDQICRVASSQKRCSMPPLEWQSSTLRDHLKLFSRYHACWAPPRHTLHRPSSCATGRRGSSWLVGPLRREDTCKSHQIGYRRQVPFSAERDKAAHLHRLPQLFLPSNSIAAWTRQACVLIRHKGSCHNPRACSWSRFPSKRKLYL